MIFMTPTLLTACNTLDRKGQTFSLEYVTAYITLTHIVAIGSTRKLVIALNIDTFQGRSPEFRGLQHHPFKTIDELAARAVTIS